RLLVDGTRDDARDPLVHRRGRRDLDRADGGPAGARIDDAPLQLLLAQHVDVEDVDDAGPGRGDVRRGHGPDLGVEAQDLDRAAHDGRVGDRDAVDGVVTGVLVEDGGGDLGADAHGVAGGECEDGCGHEESFPEEGGDEEVRERSARAARQTVAVSVPPTSPPFVTIGRPAWSPPTTKPEVARGTTSAWISMPAPPRPSRTSAVTSPPVV